MEPVRFTRGPADYLKVVMVYGIAAPMVLLFAGLLLVLLVTGLDERDVLRIPPALEAPLYVTLFALPSIGGLVQAVKRYRRWSIDAVIIGADRIGWSRKGVSGEILFDDLSLVRLESGRCELRSRNGPALSLRSPTWPAYDMNHLLRDRAAPRMIERMASCLRSGETLGFGTPARTSLIYLAGGAIILSLGLIIGFHFLASLRNGTPIPQFALVAFGSVGFGGAFLRRFLRAYGHRVEMDRMELRLFSIPRWRTIPWTQVRIRGEDADGLEVQGDWPSTPARIDQDVDNYPVICGMMRRLARDRDESA